MSDYAADKASVVCLIRRASIGDARETGDCREDDVVSHLARIVIQPDARDMIPALPLSLRLLLPPLVYP
jgi:hypothetical protein